MVFPSLEAFEQGVNLPSVYVIFYDYFVKSSVGDSAWKEACLEAVDPTEPIAVPQGESFALLLLKNNYFAWLWEAKTSLGDRLITDYDTANDRMYHGEIGDIVLKCQIDLDVEEDEVDWDKILVKQDVNPQKYDSLHKAADTKLKKLRQLASTGEKYKKFKMALDEEGSGAEEENAMFESRNKKRKVLKAFREYTNPKDEEGKFKGWSTRAANDMKAHMRRLAIVTPKDKLFRRVYRRIYQESKIHTGKKKKATEEEVPENYEVEMWGLTENTIVRL